MRLLVWASDRRFAIVARYRTWRLFRRGVPQRWRLAEQRRRTP